MQAVDKIKLFVYIYGMDLFKTYVTRLVKYFLFYGRLWSNIPVISLNLSQHSKLIFVNVVCYVIGLE